MSRSTRLRKVPARFRTEDAPLIDEKIPSGRTKLQKGNEIIKNDVLVSMRSPVLRDRTNLNVETAKVDVKKGGGGGEGKKDVKKVEKPAAPKKTTKRELRSTEKKDENIEDKKTSTTRRGAKVFQDKAGIVEKTPTGETTKVENSTRIPRPTRSGKKVTKAEVDVGPEPPQDAQPSTNANKQTRNSDQITDKIPEVPKETRSKKLSSADDKTPAPTVSSKGLIKTRESITGSKRILSRRSIPKSNNKSLTKPEKRFFKSQRNVPVSHSKISPMKRGLIKPKKVGARKKNSSPNKSYQPTLQESFAKAKKSLRPRRIAQNYNEQSTIIENKKQKTETEGDRPKGPVYKTLVNAEEEKAKDKEEVYEFSFDSNDSEERLPKKRKKKTVRKAPAKRAKRAPKPQSTATNSAPSVNKQDVDINKNPQKAVIEGISENPQKPAKNISEHIETPEAQPSSSTVEHDNVETAAQFQQASQRNSPVEEIPEAFEVTADVHAPPSPQIDVEEPPNIPIHKPKIVSNEKLDGERRISLTSTPLQSNEDRPLRKMNPFTRQPSSQYKTMMNHSLIRRSFSPIVKENNNEKFDVNSPWRPLAPNTFSNVKNIFQSTPHAKKFLTPHGISSLATENKRTMSKINKIVEQNDENKNSSILLQKSPRKFGTVLSNMASSPTSPGISPRMSSSNENNSLTENKENSRSPRKSPKKSPLKQRVTPLISRNSPSRPENKMDEPQPGPSGLAGFVENKILKQSNLNNFLNIPDMPASTTITTAHGIFDDAHSTPIPGKPVKKVVKNFDVSNAFGFEEESTLDLSSISENIKEQRPIIPKPTATKETIERPVRLPIKEVKNVLTEKNLNAIEKIPEDKKPNAPVKRPTREDISEAADHFANTFDTDDESECPADDAELPLFIDPEPVHFKQAPRYSYTKRKRAVKFDTSGETEHECSDSEGDEDEENHPRRKPKKRKITKAAKEQQKQLDEWAKSVNETFNEIENFDLVVE